LSARGRKDRNFIIPIVCDLDDLIIKCLSVEIDTIAPFRSLEVKLDLITSVIRCKFGITRWDYLE
jgi:hypothetical protein